MSAMIRKFQTLDLYRHLFLSLLGILQNIKSKIHIHVKK
jgi:hypothetical protein